MIDFLNFYLIPGLVLGSIYALGAIGITLTFSILRFANFAHGELVTLGAFFAFTVTSIIGTSSLPMIVFVALPISMALTAVAMIGVDAIPHGKMKIPPLAKVAIFGVILSVIFISKFSPSPILLVLLAFLAAFLLVYGLDRLFFKPLRDKPVIMVVIASFGLMLMVRSTIQLSWGVQVKGLIKGIQPPMIFFDVLRISPKHITMVACALVLMGVVHYILSYTKIGKAMRAMSDSPELARLTGIDTEMVIKATWIIGASLAAAAGVLLAMDSPLDTMMGFKILLPVFAAAILGGLGKPYGAMVGGLIIGIAEEITSYPWFGADFGPLIDPNYKQGVAFGIMVLMLLWRPHGIFKGRVF